MNPPPVLRELDQTRLTKCIASVENTFKDSYIVQPTDLLRKHNEATAKIAASDLTLPGENSLKEVEKYHFRKVRLNSVFEDCSSLQKETNAFLTALATQLFVSTRCHRLLIPAVLSCQAEIVSNVGFREGIADPILKLLCFFWNLTVCGWGTMVLQWWYLSIL